MLLYIKPKMRKGLCNIGTRLVEKAILQNSQGLQGFAMAFMLYPNIHLATTAYAVIGVPIKTIQI